MRKDALYKEFEDLVKATYKIGEIYEEERKSDENIELMEVLEEAVDALDRRLEIVLQNLFDVIEEEMLGEDERE